MAKNFNSLRAKARKRDPNWDKDVAEYKRAMEDALALAQLREAQDVTQSDLALRLDVTQANISLLEQRAGAGNSIYLSTLTEYVEALGGRLEVRAVFDNGVDALLKFGQR
ncbi:MAG: XRE family transcriptional regulator [Solirubrobacterales bacterium]